MNHAAARPLDTPARSDAPARIAGGQPNEFFRYHGIWAPGVRLFRTLGVGTKAWVIAATFLLPLSVLSWSYFGNQAAQIDFSARERVGVVYARELMPLLDALQRRSLLATQGQGGADAEAAARAVSERSAALEAVEKLHGETLGTAKAYAAWRSSAPAAGVSGDPAFAAHSAHIQALLDLLGQSTDGSNLTLDPDIDTYYLMDAAMFRLPVMMEAASQIRSIGAAVLAKGQATPVQTRRLIEQLALLANNDAAMGAGIDKSIAYNADVKTAANPAAVRAALRTLAERVEQTVLRSEGAQGDVAAHIAASTQAIDAMAVYAKQAGAELDRLVAVRVASLEQARNLCVVAVVFGLLLSGYLFTVFRKVLEGGLREVGFHIDAMRDGDLTTCPRAWGADEVAHLMNALTEMQSSLRSIVQRVRGSSDTIVGASTQIAGGATDLQARTEQTASSLQETAAAMEEITATVQRNADTLHQAAQLAETNARAAGRSGDIIGQVMQTMQAINTSSGRIGDIIGTIDGIAFQTNILALNAAVEAARAGEQGRGFAVVASEVRALAQRSAAAAREIKGLITTSIGQVEGGVRVVRDAGGAIGEVVGSSRRVSELLAEAEVGAREQSQGVVQSATAVQQMDTATQQNAALVEQTAAAAGELQRQAEQLAAGVAQFRLPA